MTAIRTKKAHYSHEKDSSHRLPTPLLLTLADKVDQVLEARIGLLGRRQDLVLGQQEPVLARVAQLDGVRVLDASLAICPNKRKKKERTSS